MPVSKAQAGAIKWAGKEGFTATRDALAEHPDKVDDPDRLAGWLKARAREGGMLAVEHGGKRGKKWNAKKKEWVKKK